MSRLRALGAAFEKLHEQFNCDGHNDCTINIDHVLTITRYEKTVFRKERNVGYETSRGKQFDGQVEVVGIMFQLIGNVHRQWVFPADQRDVRDKLYRSLSDHTYTQE